jgi:hypothetical protein
MLFQDSTIFALSLNLASMYNRNGIFKLILQRGINKRSCFEWSFINNSRLVLVSAAYQFDRKIQDGGGGRSGQSHVKSPAIRKTKRPICALRGISNRCGVHIRTHAFSYRLRGTIRNTASLDLDLFTNPSQS